MQIVVALRFYATGNFQAMKGDVSRENIFMPVYHQRLSKLMLDFSRISNFPNTTVAIDGTHIRIKSPSVDEHLYVNRKGYHSNVQGACDSDLIFLNVVAKWPGGTCNSHIRRFFPYTTSLKTEQ